MVKVNLIGNIHKIGDANIEASKSLKDILVEYGGGMTDDLNPELVQVGGPLGLFVSGDLLAEPLEELWDGSGMASILFLNRRFCPVDYSKFLLGYVRKELGIQNEELKTLEKCVEALSSGHVTKYTMIELTEETEEPSSDEVVSKVKWNIQYLLGRYKEVFEAHYEQGKCEAGICYRLYDAQCVNACPANINIPGYVALMYQGQDEEAYRLMRRNNPLSLICGKICARPCEDRCRRGEIEKTVGVRALKHYAASTSLDKAAFTEAKLPFNGKSVGVIGAGPAGLSAAYYLALTGYGVKIYEKHPVPGGMLAVGVPSYRLSQTSIDKEVALIEKLGVEIHLNAEVGQDISFDDLMFRHDSLLLASGCHVANTFSDHLTNLESAIDFLRQVKLEGRQSVGKEVIVIGGGDVAMDAARTSVRLGADKVTVVSLETYLQMPANDEEKEEALAEGIHFHNGYGTKEIHESKSEASGITFKKVIDLYDLNNRFSPKYDDNQFFYLDADHIILAIGQKSDLTYLPSSVETDDRNRILYNKHQSTSRDGIFLAGDIGGPGSAIKAIAEGKKAADEIDRYLGGWGLFLDEPISVPNYQNHYAIWDTDIQSEPVKLYSESCQSPFEENKTALTAEMAQCEAMRCMRCDRNSQQ